MTFFPGLTPNPCRKTRSYSPKACATLSATPVFFGFPLLLCSQELSGPPFVLPKLLEVLEQLSRPVIIGNLLPRSHTRKQHVASPIPDNEDCHGLPLSVRPGGCAISPLPLPCPLSGGGGPLPDGPHMQGAMLGKAGGSVASIHLLLRRSSWIHVSSAPFLPGWLSPPRPGRYPPPPPLPRSLLLPILLLLLLLLLRLLPAAFPPPMEGEPEGSHFPRHVNPVALGSNTSTSVL